MAKALSNAETAILTVGVLMLIAGALYPLYPFVTLVLDNTPPVITGTIPSSGSTYSSLTEIWCTAYDVESGITSVTALIDGETVGLGYYSGSATSTSGANYKATKTIGAGSHTFKFTVKNGVGLITEQSGTFTVYIALQGKWYINTVEITSTSQTIYSTSLTVAFKFVKTAGVEDSKISCKVTFSGPASGTITLSKTATGTWETSYTFSTKGQYSATLTADDGTKTVTFSIIDFQLGEEDWWEQYFTMRNMMMVGGAILIVTALVLKARRE